MSIINIRTPTFPSSSSGWVEHILATVPCSGARAKDWHRNVVHDTIGEIGTDVAVNARPRTWPSANGECRSPDLQGEERSDPSVDKDWTWCPWQTAKCEKTTSFPETWRVARAKRTLPAAHLMPRRRGVATQSRVLPEIFCARQIRESRDKSSGRAKHAQPSRDANHPASSGRD